MLKPPATVSMAFVRGMVSGLQARGIDCEPYMVEAQIDPALFHETSARVTAQQYCDLFTLLVERLHDDGLGFFSRKLPVGTFALVVRNSLGAPTLEVAMQRIARAHAIVQDDVELLSVREGELAGWALKFKGSEPPFPFFHEMLLRFYWRTLAWLIGGRLKAAYFDLAFACPPYVGSYANALPGEIRFEQPLSAFWFDARALTEPVRRDDAAMRVFVRNVVANVMLPRSRDDSLVSRVRLHLQQAQPAWPDLAGVAQALHMSVSTLQRNLAAEGMTFQALKDELRRDMAISRLNTSAVPLATLAMELGFSDSAAFQRAFKTWTGSPPGAYRKRAA